MTEQPAWLSITAYGRVYGADRKTVHKWLAAGLLEFYRVDRFIRIKNHPPRQFPVQREDAPPQRKQTQSGQ